MRVLFAFIATLVALQLTGCASVANGTSGPIRVETVASNGEAVIGAKCDLTNDFGTFSIVTPGSVIVHRSSKDLQVTCKKDGMDDATASVTSRVAGSMFGNIVLGGAIGAVVDHSNGSAYNYPEWMKFVMGQYAIFDRKDSVDAAPTPSRAAPVASASAATAK